MLQPAVSHASFEIIREVIPKIPVGLQGENASKVFFVRRKITVTLSIFNFSPWFFAQIVENRSGRLSGPFYGPRDNFPKSYHENDYYSIVLFWKFEFHRPTPRSNLRNIILRIQHPGSLIQFFFRITVTLSIFNFGPWFFAQIVENRRGRLSGPIYGPRDNFPKSYRDDHYYSIVHIWKFWCHRAEPRPNLRNIISRIQHPGSLIQKI